MRTAVQIMTSFIPVTKCSLCAKRNYDCCDGFASFNNGNGDILVTWVVDQVCYAALGKFLARGLPLLISV